MQNKNKKANANQKGKKLDNPCKDWILDYPCTFHICPNQDWFSTYETVFKGAVLITDDNF